MDTHLAGRRQPTGRLAAGRPDQPDATTHLTLDQPRHSPEHTRAQHTRVEHTRAERSGVGRPARHTGRESGRGDTRVGPGPTARRLRGAWIDGHGLAQIRDTDTDTTPTPTPASASASASSGSASVVDGEGVSLPDGSWVPWVLALAISAAGAMVWLQRRRRYIPNSGDDEWTDLPAPVTRLQRAAARNPDLPRPVDEVEKAAAVPPLETLPAGGIGLVGDAAAGAARAAVIAVLASGGPRSPHERGEVVIDAATLTTLIGSDAVTLGSWPRLHVADDLDTR